MNRTLGLLCSAVGIVLTSFAATAPVDAAEGSDSSGTHSYSSTCADGLPVFTNTSDPTSTGEGVIEVRFGTTTRTLLPGQTVALDPGAITPATPWEVFFFDLGVRNLFDNGTFGEICSTTPPTPPRSLTATPGNGRVTLRWSAPANIGGTPVTDYVIQRSRNGTTGWVTVNDGVGTQLTRTVVGLANGTRQYFRVIAKNAAGSSSPSNVVNSVPRTRPTAPRRLTATPTNRSGQVRLSWLSPASNGGSRITDYAIQRSPNGRTNWSTIKDGVATTTNRVVSGLRNGTRYHFRVIAKTSVGNSVSSNVVSAIPRTRPSVPRRLTATPANGRAVLRWVAPASNGGSPITDYVIQRYVGGRWVTVPDGKRSTPTYTVTRLRNGATYRFRVLARNAAGQSAWSTTVTVTPRTVASAPRAVRATAGDHRVTVQWSAPASNGGAPITRYLVQRSTRPTSGWSTVRTVPASARSAVVASLTNGDRYYFRVVAVNAAGNRMSSVVNAVPMAPPRSYYPNCAAVRAAGRDPLRPGQPGYRFGLDRDRDGLACE